MKRWLTFLFIGVLLFSSYLSFKREETYQTSSTNDVVVTGKSKKDGKYTIEADLCMQTQVERSS
ncbi:hypothetical protein [Mesobacillus foraminis]|uniref:Uncharacterized protein n=1 Tax=Mesobacillus foraminis TaxID=279826 RepID=A0A4R2B0U4_9BACI|nr:hypothetical protein [Mesobacillus foraminis]TCN19763.1 hypothetical protein EV146_11668 [Mesobacillus foraminis]